MVAVGVAEELEENEDDEERAETGCTVAGGEDDGEVDGGVSAEEDDSFPLMALLLPLMTAEVSPFCLLLVVRLRPPVGEALGDAVRDEAVGAEEETGDPGAGETRPGGVAVAAAAAEAIRVGEEGRDGMVALGLERVAHLLETLGGEEREVWCGRLNSFLAHE